MVYKIGELICQKRKELHITQESLCTGICETSTLSKIENGQHYPTKERLDALLQRLGLDSSCYNAYISVVEFETHELMYLLTEQIANCEFEKAKKTLDNLMNNVKTKNNILRQFVLYNEIILGSKQMGGFSKFTNKQLLEEMLKAIRYTLPKIDLEEINKCLLSIQEITILDSIANLHYKMNKRKNALYLYEQILRYVQLHCLSMRDAATIIPLITYNYSRTLILQNRFEEALEIAETGCYYCIRYQKTSLIGHLLYNKAYCILELRQETIPTACEILKQSYYILRLFKNNKLASQIAKESKDMWNITIC